MKGTRGAIVRWLALVVALVCADGAPAVEGDAASPPQNLEFHRVYIPAEQLQKGNWNQGYLPIERAQFERLIDRVSMGARGAPGVRGAHPKQIQWHAQLVGDDLLVGTATLELVRTSEEPSLLPLTPWSLAVGRGTWRDRSQPARLGTGPDGQFGVLVEGSTLELEWSLRGERTASGAVAFHMQLPQCPVHRLTVELPAELELLSEAGVVSRATTSSPKLARWTVELGGHHDTTLRVVSAAVARERRPLTLLRQLLTYDFSHRGINVGAQLKLDIHGEPIRRLAIDLDPSLMLVAARYGELPIPWSATIDVETRISHVLLQLPEPIAGTGRVVQLSAIAPLVTGRRLRLPGLQAESVSWQEGTAVLLIPDSLVAEQLAFDGCRQSQSAARPAPQTGEAIEVQYYRPGATIDVLLSLPRSQMKVDSGALVEVGAGEISSQLAVTLSVPTGQRRELEMSVRPGWTIDAVSYATSARAVEWEVDEASASAQLRVRLDEAVTPQSPTRLVVRGHRPLPATPSFEAGQFEMVDFGAWRIGTQLISVRASEGTQLRWSGAVDLKRLDPLELPAAQLELFARPPNGLLFAADAVFAQSIVALDRRKPSFTADIRLDAVVQRDVLTETYTVSCVPESAHAERLLIRLSQARPAALEWKLAGANSGQFSARRISAGEQAQAGLSAGGEAWELSLRLARPGPFELRAVRSVAFDGETHLALASVADAASQRGTVTVRALGNSGLAIKNRRLTSVPAELLDPAHYQTTRASFHYQPTSDDIGIEPAISLEPADPTQVESGVWAWNSELESSYYPEQAVHRAVYFVQTAGKEQFEVELPEGASLQGVWVNRERLAANISAEGERRFTVDLPPGERAATVTVCFGTNESLPALSATRHAPFPRVGMPVLTHHWRIALPGDFGVLESDARVPSDTVSEWSWSERLFGMLARSSRTPRFNPLSMSDWRALWAPASDREQAAIAGAHLLDALGALMSESLRGDSESQLTWGQLMAQSADIEAKERRTLLIDADTLARAGLSPESRVRFQAGNSDRERAQLLLEPLNIAVLVQGGLVALVSRSEINQSGGRVELTDTPLVYAVLSGPWHHRLSWAARSDSTLRYVSANRWRAGLALSTPAGLAATESPARELAESHAWNTYAWHFDGDESPQVRVAHLPAVAALAWAILIGATALGIWLAPRPAYLATGAASLAACALWLPAAFAPLASAGFLACLTCLATRLVRIVPARERPSKVTSQPRSSRMRVSALEPGITVVLLSGLLAINAVATAQQLSDEKPAPAARSARPADGDTSTVERGSQPPARGETPYQVLVPVNAQGAVVEGAYYIPNEFYQKLHRLASAASGQPKRWLVSRAAYQGTITRDPVTKELGMPQLKASFDLRVFQSNVEVSLSLPREPSAGLITSARLEGRPVAPRWSEDGSELVVGPLAQGDYRLELEMRPGSQVDGPTAGVQVPVPPLANAVITLTLPADGPTIELPSAHGRIRTDKDRNELQAQLGAVDRLIVHWPAGVSAQAVSPTIDVDELVWMRVRPGTTILEAKFKYRVLEGRLRQIRLLADPRLRLLPSTNPRSPIATVRSTPGDPQRIDLELSRDVEDQVVIDLSFLLTGASGVGNLRLPRLESAGARAAKRWLAVNVDPALEYREQLGEDSKPLPVNEFAAAWGLTDVRPQAVYNIPRGEAMWVLATQPIEPKTSVSEVLAVSVGNNSTAFALTANLAIEQGYLFQLPLQLPRQATVERVSLVEGEMQRVSRWSLDDEGRLTIFLTGPLTGQHQLRIHGQVDADSQTPATMPHVELQGVLVKRRELQVFRQSDLLAAIEANPAFKQVEPSPLDVPDEFGSLLAAFDGSDPKASLIVNRSPNTPQVKALMATALSQSSDSWTAEMDCRLSVTGGLVDALSFEIPPQWSEPYQVEPQMRLKIVPIPGEARRQMVVYPPKPVDGSIRLKIRGRVALSPGDRLRVPEIMPLRAQDIGRYVIVPRTLDRQQISWETIGLTPAELPAELADTQRDAGPMAIYQVAGERYQAAIKAVRRSSAGAQVKLADIQLAFSGDNRFRGVAMYSLNAPSTKECVVELPAGCRLVHAELDGLPAQADSLDERRWRISLGHQQLPQRLELVYCGSLAGSSMHKHFQAPRIEGFEAATTLWTIDSPPEFAHSQPQEPRTLVDRATQMIVRLETIGSLVQLPSDAIAENLPEDLVRWYRPWNRRFQDVRAALAGELVAAPRTGALADQEAAAEALDRQLSATDARIGGGAASHRTIDTSLPDVSRFVAANREATRSYYRTSGPAGELDIRYARVAAATMPERIFLGLLIVAIGAAAVGWLRSRPLPQFAPSTILAALGVLWWLVLAPSIVGLLLLLLAVALAWFRSNQRARWAVAR